MTRPVLVVGEALVDVVAGADGRTREHPGGSPMNVAIGLARLGHPVTLAAWLATDERGAVVEAHLAADGVELVAGSTGADRTSTATATLDRDQAATYEFDIDWRLPQPLPTDVGHLHTGSIATVLQPGAARVRAAVLGLNPHATVSLDPNVRPSLMGDPADVRPVLEELIGYTDVVKASDEDLAWLYGADADTDEVLRLWARLGPSVTVLTRGAHGARAHVAPADTYVDVPGRQVEVVDTVGAGDSFMSALVGGLLDRGLLGSPEARQRLRSVTAEVVRAVLDEAADAAAITVSRAGAQPPTRADLHR